MMDRTTKSDNPETYPLGRFDQLSDRQLLDAFERAASESGIAAQGSCVEHLQTSAPRIRGELDRLLHRVDLYDWGDAMRSDLWRALVIVAWVLERDRVYVPGMFSGALTKVRQFRLDAENPDRDSLPGIEMLRGWLRRLHMDLAGGWDQDTPQDRLAEILGEHPRSHPRFGKVTPAHVTVEGGLFEALKLIRDSLLAGQREAAIESLEDLLAKVGNP